MILSDQPIGQSVLKVQGGVNGQSTDWVDLKPPSTSNDTEQSLGRVLVSISREMLEVEGDYTHLVQNTEECMMVGGDQDDPQIDDFDQMECAINLP